MVPLLNLLLFQRAWVVIVVPTGGSEATITQVTGDLMPSSGLHGYLPEYGPHTD